MERATEFDLELQFDTNVLSTDVEVEPKLNRFLTPKLKSIKICIFTLSNCFQFQLKKEEKMPPKRKT